ncbi:MAG: TolC family protein [Prevotella sp.]|nr:TolC family protein [Prevotella sp.]
MRYFAALLIMSIPLSGLNARQVVDIDSCRAMALRNNKQMSISAVKRDMARNIRKSARTKYLPGVHAFGSYMYTSREISLLNGNQKSALSNIGSTAAGGINSALQNAGASLTPDQLAAINGQLGALGTSIDQIASGFNEHLNSAAAMLDAGGRGIVDAFRTDTRNIFAGSVLVTQPIYMGGSIRALNRMADIGEQLTAGSAEAVRQQTIYDTDKAYWTVVSLKHKKRLAESYLELIKKLRGDVYKMIGEGVATRAEGLSVDVKVNEAEMTLLQVDDGLTLSRMLLCQQCGLPVDTELITADEDNDSIVTAALPVDNSMTEKAADNRPEIHVLQAMADMSKQAVNLLKAGNLPKIGLTGGYTITNPNVYDGYRRSFGGVWNVGVLVSIPVWNWGDVAYKVRAAKGASAIAALEVAEAREKIELQVSQSAFKVGEASKRMSLAASNVKRAEENLRSAELGFREGVMPATTVMEAQTAWLQARSQKIDAEIDLRLSDVNMRKALGTLE